jgi:hypothetical protein
LAAAVLDHAVSDGNTTSLCKRLNELNIPFVLYTGFSKLKGECAAGVHVAKPANPDALVATVAGLLRS